MGKPIVFSGKDAKLLTPRDLVGSDGNIFPKTGEKNYVNSPSAYTNSSTTLGWGVSGAGITAATDTTVADLPRPLTSKSGILLTGVSGSTAYAYYRFVLDDADAGKKLKFQIDMKPGTAVASDFKVDVYSNTASDYSTGNTRLSLSTDSSSVSVLPALTGTYRTTFDSPAITAKWIEVRVGLNQANTHTLCISDVVVGPGVVVQGAAVSGWTSYTPGFRGDSNSLSFTNTTINGYWRRVGSSMEVHVDAVFTGTPGTATGSFIVDLPTGYLIDTSVSSASVATAVFGIASGYNGAKSLTYVGAVANSGADLSPTNGSIVIMSIGSTAWNATTPRTWAITDGFSLQFTVPIASWNGAGTVNVVSNDVEYFASTSGTWDAAATSGQTVYGPQGVPISGALTASRNKVCQTVTQITATTQLVIQYRIAGTNTWINAVDSQWPQQANASIAFGGNVTSSTAANLVQISFNRWAAAGTAYGTSTGAIDYNAAVYDFWRIAKYQGGQAIGFSEVVPGTSSGLVGAAGLKGNTTGNAIATGCVGEIVQSTQGATFNLTSSGTATSGNLTVSAGTWVIYVTTWLANGGTITQPSAKVLIDGGGGTTLGYDSLPDQHTTAGSLNIAGPSFVITKTKSSSFTVALAITCGANTGTSSVFYTTTAVRIA